MEHKNEDEIINVNRLSHPHLNQQVQLFTLAIGHKIYSHIAEPHFRSGLRR